MFDDVWHIFMPVWKGNSKRGMDDRPMDLGYYIPDQGWVDTCIVGPWNTMRWIQELTIWFSGDDWWYGLGSWMFFFTTILSSAIRGHVFVSRRQSLHSGSPSLGCFRRWHTNTRNFEKKLIYFVPQLTFCRKYPSQGQSWLQLLLFAALFLLTADTSRASVRAVAKRIIQH